jgi:glutamate formiminotransferase
MQPLVECVPNFSEGRDKSKVDAIVEAMKLDGVYLLDREMESGRTHRFESTPRRTSATRGG